MEELIGNQKFTIKHVIGIIDSLVYPNLTANICDVNKELIFLFLLTTLFSS